MNESERLDYISQFKPGKQLIKVYKLTDNSGKISRTELFIGFLTSVSTGALYLVPLSEYGESKDSLAASPMPWPWLRNDAQYQYSIWKEV